MCGIGGYSLSVGGNPDSDWLNTASKLLSHRGPDDNGVYEDQSNLVGLVHTRLSILDLSERVINLC